MNSVLSGWETSEVEIYHNSECGTRGEKRQLMHVDRELKMENKDSGKCSGDFSLKTEEKVGKTPQDTHRLGKKEKLIRK